MENYTDINSKTVDGWVEAGWEWGLPVSHDECLRAAQGDFSVLLTPTKHVPREWFPELRGARILGLASGGAQQMPLFAVQGAVCSVLDFSEKQLESERAAAAREGYAIETVRADMTLPLPFPDDCFDLIFHPVSNCYIRDVEPVWRECFRVLKHGGRLLAGLGNGISYAFDDDGKLDCPLPFDPLSDPALYEESLRNDWGIQFSHGIEEQVGGQLRAGLRLLDIYQDTDGAGPLHDYGVPTFFATCSVKD